MVRIKEAREAKGWTQEQLAAMMSTTQQTIQRWESGYTDVKSSQLKELSRVLGMTVSYIIGVDDSDGDDVGHVSKDEQELLSLYRKMADEDKPKLIVQARDYALLGETKKETARRVEDGVIDGVRG